MRHVYVGYVGHWDDQTLVERWQAAWQRKREAAKVRLEAERARQQAERQRELQAQAQPQLPAPPSAYPSVLCPACRNCMQEYGWEEVVIPAGTTASVGGVILGALVYGFAGALVGGLVVREPVYRRALRIHCYCPSCGFRVVYLRG